MKKFLLISIIFIAMLFGCKPPSIEKGKVDIIPKIGFDFGTVTKSMTTRSTNISMIAIPQGSGATDIAIAAYTPFISGFSANTNGLTIGDSYRIKLLSTTENGTVTIGGTEQNPEFIVNLDDGSGYARITFNNGRFNLYQELTATFSHGDSTGQWYQNYDGKMSTMCIINDSTLDSENNYQAKATLVGHIDYNYTPVNSNNDYYFIMEAEIKAGLGNDGKYYLGMVYNKGIQGEVSPTYIPYYPGDILADLKTQYNQVYKNLTLQSIGNLMIWKNEDGNYNADNPYPTSVTNVDAVHTLPWTMLP